MLFFYRNTSILHNWKKQSNTSFLFKISKKPTSIMAHDHRNEADDSEFNQFYCSPSGNSKSSCIQHLFFLVFHSVNNKPINIANYCFFQIKGYVYRTINSLSALMKGPRRRDHISAFLKSTRKNARTTWISKSQFSFPFASLFFFIAINLLFYLLPLFFTYTHKHTHIQVQDGIISTSPPMHMTDLSPLVMVAPSWDYLCRNLCVSSMKECLV